jgi:hypothetical protein
MIENVNSFICLLTYLNNPFCTRWHIEQKSATFSSYAYVRLLSLPSFSKVRSHVFDLPQSVVRVRKNPFPGISKPYQV